MCCWQSGSFGLLEMYPHNTLRRPNKRVQSDAAAAAGIGAKFGYVTCFELKGTSEKSRRG